MRAIELNSISNHSGCVGGQICLTIFFRLFANQPMPKAPSFGIVRDLSLGMK